MDKELKNNIEIGSLKNVLSKKLRHGNDGVKFVGEIIYKAYNTVFVETLDVYLIGGFTPMVRLDLDEKGKIITSAKFHLDFKSNHQDTTFSFNKSEQILKIEGINSPKLGSYEVLIKEAI